MIDNKQKALFLDRDGVINIDHGYIFKHTEFEFKSGIFELCAHAQSLGYVIIVITNQSGIARGYYSEDDFLMLTQWMTEKFKDKNITLTDTYFCPHHPTLEHEGSPLDKYRKMCDCRKPKPGMILSAMKEHQINLTESIFIGDKLSDMEAAKSSGILNRFLISSDYVKTVLSKNEHSNDDIYTEVLSDLKQAMPLM